VSELDQTDDGFLIGSIVNGDVEAVRMLVERYQRPLAGLLRRALSGSSDAEDLAQETWIRVVRSAHRYDPSFPFTSWLFAIAWNLIRNFWAAHRETTEADLVSIPTGEASAEEKMLTTDRDRRLRDLIAALPQQLAEAILLRYFEELSEREMAEQLGVPVGTVKSRLHYGMKKLAASIQENRGI